MKCCCRLTRIAGNNPPHIPSCWNIAIMIFKCFELSRSYVISKASSLIKALSTCIHLFLKRQIFPSVFKTKNISVVVNFLCQVIFIFSLFLGTVLYANEFETNEKQKLTEIKNFTATFPHVVYNLYRWKHDSIPDRACVMLVEYDLWHHCIWKTPFSSIHMKTRSKCFQKSLLWRVSLKICIFGDLFH